MLQFETLLRKSKERNRLKKIVYYTKYINILVFFRK